MCSSDLMDKLGLVNERFVVAHGVWLDNDDMKRLGDRGASVSHNPGSNMRLGNGLADVRGMLSAKVNVGVGTMVQSFRLTFVGWLDQRLPSELYVTTRSLDESRKVHDWLAARSDAVLPVWSTEVRMFGQPVQVYGIADHPTYRQHWPMLQATPDAWDRIAKGEEIGRAHV